MSKLAVYNMNGVSTGEVEISDSLLLLDRGEQAVHDVVVAHNAAVRAGTASTLTKGEVAGSGRKPWQQKGTGRARAGYRQSPIWRGGGVVFGPKPRDYSKKVNKKVARLAFRRVLSQKIAAGCVKIVGDLNLDSPKTRQLRLVMKSLGLARGALFVLKCADRNFLLASRNIANVEATNPRDLSVCQLLRYPAIVVDPQSVEELKGRLGSNNGKDQ